MFGYINVYKDELKVREYQVFRSYYCGLCKEQGKLLGAVTRLGLSYDFTMLAILLDSVLEEENHMRLRRCAAHPLTKRMVTEGCEALAYSAYMSVALTYYKIKDDVLDRTLSPAGIALPFFAFPAKKVRRAYREKLKVIEENLAALHRAELEKSRDVDAQAACFARIMEELFDYPGLEETRVLRQMGKELGRWLYLIDAMDDFEKDREKGRYNPFESQEQRNEAVMPLWYNLHQVAAAYELLNLKKNKGLLDNIIYLGLKGATAGVVRNFEVNRNESI